jgi:hypothetical protein
MENEDVEDEEDEEPTTIGKQFLRDVYGIYN